MTGRGRLVAGALAAVVGCVVGVWACWRVFVVSRPGRRVDEVALIGARHGRTTLWRFADRVLEPVSVGYVVVALVTVVVIAVARRRWQLAGQAVALLVGANLTTAVLKRYVVLRPDLGDWPHYGNTLPSGHTTAAAAASAALLLVVPPRGRPAVAGLGALYTLVTGWSTLVGQWHRPSDVVAAVCVVTGWFALVVLAGAAIAPSATTVTGALPVVAGSRSAAAPRATLLVLIGLGLVGAVAAAAVIGSLWSGTGLPGRSGQLAAYGGGVVAIGAAACLGTAVQLGLREAAGRLGPVAPGAVTR